MFSFLPDRCLPLGPRRAAYVFVCSAARRLSERPFGLVCMQKLVGFVGQGFIKVLGIYLGDGAVFVGEAHRVVPVQAVEPLAPFPGQFLSIPDGLASPSGAAARGMP